MSIGSPERLARKRRSTSAALACAGKTRSQATASASQSIALASTACEALCASGADRDWFSGRAISVATRGMRQSAEGEADGLVKNAILIAGPTASGKSAMALELALR